MLQAYARWEETIASIMDAIELQDGVNLWTLLRGRVDRGDDPEKLMLKPRLSTLRQRLDVLAIDTTRPNNVLHAKTIRAFLDLTAAPPDEAAARDALKRVADCFDRSGGLGLYPIQKFIHLLSELGEFIGDLEGYQEAFELAVQIAGARDGEVRQGQLLLRRGLQQLEKDQVEDALVGLGKARMYLGKDEVLLQAVRAIIGSAWAYERLGLYWAAHMDMLFALHLAIQQIEAGDDPPKECLIAAMRLAWLELRLGRLPLFLAFFSLSLTLAKARGEHEALSEEFRDLDRAASVLFLRAPLSELRHLPTLEAALEAHDLWASWCMLLFALGHVDELIEGGFAALGDEETPEEVMARWVQGPGAAEISDVIELHARTRCEYRTRLLGCEITIDLPTDDGCIALAENLLGLLESFLATATHEDFVFLRSRARIKLWRSDFAPSIPEVRVSSDTDLEIICGHGLGRWMDEQGREGFVEFARIFLARVLSLLARFGGDLEEALTRLGNDSAFVRALGLGAIATAWGTVGLCDKFRLSDWASDTDLRLIRTTEWFAGRDIAPKTEPCEPQQAGSKRVLHRDHVVSEVVLPDLWARAQWDGMGFFREATGTLPPTLAFVFGERSAGLEIFERWRALVGDDDQDELIRVAIIEEVSGPGSYAITVGPNTKAVTRASPDRGKLFFGASNAKLFERTEGVHRRHFGQHYEKLGTYYLTPATLSNDGSVEPAGDLEIKKHELRIANFANLAPGDSDRELLLRTRLVRTKAAKVGRNEPCPCGSGKKHKKCCGQ